MIRKTKPINQLRDYQKAGVDFIQKRNGNALIADEMGLGKTIQTLSWLCTNPSKMPALVVCPASLKLNWESEAKRWLPPDVRIKILSGSKIDFSVVFRLEEYDFLIINFEVLARVKKGKFTKDSWIQFLARLGLQTIIIDEAHRIKNRESIRSMAVTALGKYIPHRICLTGTPVLNRPIELFPILNLLKPGFMKYQDYLFRFCAPKWVWLPNGRRIMQTGASNLNTLNHLLFNERTGRVIRRTKDKVLPLKKIENLITLHLNNKKGYEDAENEFIHWLRKNFTQEKVSKFIKSEYLVKISFLRELTLRGKLSDVVLWIKDFFNDHPDEKLVIFGIRTFGIDRLMHEFGNFAVRFDGKVPLKQRDIAIKQFQTSPKTKLFVGQITCAGVGITLTKASNVAFMELPWSIADVHQASDRVHRIGQSKNVNIFYLLAKDTIEGRILRMLRQKEEIIESILSGQITNKSTMKFIVEEYMKC